MVNFAIVRHESSRRLELNDVRGKERQDLHLWHKPKIRHMKWNLPEKKTGYIMQCYKCKRILDTDQALQFHKSQRGCGHGWDCYMILEKYQVYVFEN